MKTNKLFKNFIALCMFLSFITTAIAQSTVSGTVVDAGINAPLPGASVVEKGSSSGVTSDFDGNFTFKTSSNSGEIEISYLGYSSVILSFDGNSDLQPNFTWFKCRSNAANHQLIDSVRGVNKIVNSNDDVVEVTDATLFKSFQK